MRRRNWTIPYVLFLAIFVVIPLLLIVYYAFTNDEGMFTFANFRKFMIHPEAINTFVYSVGIALITTILCLLLGYPAAWILSQARFNTSRTMVVLFILPMWVNILIRTLATVAPENGSQLDRGGARLGGESVAGIYQGRIPTIDAGSDERYHDGVYADHLYVCHRRVVDDEQYQALRYDHTGEYQ